MAKTPTPAKADDWDAATVAEVVQAPAVKVRCIVHTLPHTGQPLPGALGLGMQHKEEREVPEAIALAMEAAGQVEIL
jgi:hypothetical protein